MSPREVKQTVTRKLLYIVCSLPKTTRVANDILIPVDIGLCRSTFECSSVILST
jgi:hypothetical protein